MSCDEYPAILKSDLSLGLGVLGVPADWGVPRFWDNADFCDPPEADIWDCKTGLVGTLVAIHSWLLLVEQTVALVRFNGVKEDSGLS